MSIQAVIFDLDGVLVSTDEFHFQAWKELADAEGIPFDRRINDCLRGVSRMESLDIILKSAHRGYCEDERHSLADQKNERFQVLIRNLGPDDLLPGVERILNDLRDHRIKIAVASASKNASLILDRLNIKSMLDALADGNDVARSKPDPEVFCLIAKRLGLNPNRCLVVEDAAAGIKAALLAEMPVFALGPAADLPNVRFKAASLASVTCEDLLAAGEAQLG